MDNHALAARIAGEISELIAVGEIEPGSHLSTQRLADRFAVSRTPVREALGLLADGGSVEQRPNRGYFARAPKPVRRSSKPVDIVDPTDAPPAYYRLAEDWLTNAIDADVTEQSLMERYGLTKGQLAAILGRASGEGWIERKAGYGWRLLPVAKTPEAFDQIYRFRMVIEPAALLEPGFRLDRVVAERMLATFETMLKSSIEFWPADRLRSIGVEFHEELMRMSGNPLYLQSLVRANRFRQLLEYRTMIHRVRVYDETREHVEILEMLKAGDVVGASYLLRQHLGHALARKRAVSMRDQVSKP